MANGLRTWDNAGNLQIDISTNLCQMRGAFALTPGTNVTFTDTGLSNGQVWYMAAPTSATIPIAYSYNPATYTFTWTNTASSTDAGVVYYGTF